uniref:Serine/arginine-rich splicing factor 4 n=1 Tax=Cacopsylla melanoneura TaxID=428564 RepID=A0A8D8U7V4_9HEMI
MSTRIFVGGFSYRVRERDIERFCDRYGRIREISMKNKYAFVEFEDYRDADDAVYELNGKSLLGERVTVEIAKGIDRSQERGGRRGYGGGGGGPPPRRGWGRDRDDRFGPPTRSDHRLIVENLSSRVSWQDLKDFMRQVGEVCYADAHKRHRNEGVVEFETYSDMKKALDKLDNAELNGRRIKLLEDRPRGGSKGGRGRSRSSSSRSRSRSRSSKSRSRSKSGSPRKSKSKGKSTSRSPSPSKTRKRSRSRSESHERKHSKGSASPPEKKRSRSRSHSRSASPVDRNGDKSPVRSDNE